MSDLSVFQDNNSYNTVQSVSVTQILLQKLKHALTHKSLSMITINSLLFQSISMNKAK